MICSTLQLFTPYIPRTPTSSGVPFRQTRNKKNATSIEILLHRDPLNSRSLLRKLHRSIHQKKKNKKVPRRNTTRQEDFINGFHQEGDTQELRWRTLYNRPCCCSPVQNHPVRSRRHQSSRRFHSSTCGRC